MNAITISVTIGEDCKLMVDLPADMQVGEAELTIKLKSVKQADVALPINSTREIIRAKLLAAGRLLTSIDVPVNAQYLTDEELANYVQLPPNARPSEDLINEDRGEY